MSSGGMHVCFPPDLKQQCRASRHVNQGICGLPSRLSHSSVPRATVVGVDLGFKVEAVQGKQFSLEWTDTSGGLWECWHDPGVPLAFPVESASS